MNLKKTLFGSEDVDTKNVITFEAILLGLKRIIGKYDNITNSEQKLPFERIDYLFDNKNEKIKLDQKKKHSPEYLLSLLLDKYYGIEAITLNPQQMSKLRRKCENAKIEIQSERITSSEIIINKMRGYPSICLTPDLFEGICKDRFDEAIYFIKKLLVDSEYRVSKYAEIVFAGGSSNLKRFKDDVEQLFFPYS
ncbi:hypothetical protein B4U80_14387, partial [Leptotrombidium deliense]